MSAHERISRARASAAELGQAGLARAREGEKRYGAPAAACAALVAVFALFFLAMGAYTAWNREIPPDLADGLAFLHNYTRMLHARHDPLAPDPAAALPDPEPGPYATLHARRGLAGEPIVREPCRRLSRAELSDGTTIEGYVLPLLLMRMCEIVHELYGCDEDGVVVPKHVDTPDALNICAITYKEASGVCHHYINPVVRPVKSTMRNDITITSPHFEALGEHVLTVHPQVLVSFQPILSAQAAAEQAPASAPAVRALSDAYDALPPPDAGKWLPVIPDIQTITVNSPRAYSLFIAYSSLTGEYPFGEGQ